MPSMVFELSVEMDDGNTFTVVADQRDIAKWEVQPQGWPVSKLEENVSMGFFRYLAFSAATRQGLTSLKWQDFDAHCVEAMPLEDNQADDVQDPGNPVP